MSDRTLRRAAARGTIRARRRSERRFELPAAEALYLERRWPVLQALTDGLRTLPNVRLAVLFGSVARGDETEHSDIDLLVRLASSGIEPRGRVHAHLEDAVERAVQVVELQDVNATLLADVLRDGRVIVDRDAEWPKLLRQAPTIAAAAENERKSLEADLFASAEELLAGAGA